MDLKRICVPLVVLGAVGTVSLTGCPDKTPGKETIKNTWQDMLDQLSKMDEASMKKHWKRYYQKAIDDLQSRVKALHEKKVELMTEQEMKGKEVAELEAKAKKAKTIIKRAIAKYKEQKAEDPNRATFNINLSSPTTKYSDSEAKDQLRRWTAQYKRTYSKDRLQSKAQLVATLKNNTQRIDIAIDAYQNKIQMLKDQMEAYDAKLETAKLKESMRALAESGSELSTEKGIPELAQLSKLNKSLDKAIVKEDIRDKLAADEKSLETKKMSLDEAMKSTPDTAGASVSDLDKELDGL
jgi:chromosome segregation ATPase